MALQDDRKILLKDTARDDHVAAALLRFELEIGLHMRNEADRTDTLRLRIGLNRSDGADGIGSVAVEIEDHKRGLLFYLLKHSGFVFEEFDRHAEFLRHIHNLGGKEKVGHHGEYFSRLNAHADENRGKPNGSAGDAAAATCAGMALP